MKIKILGCGASQGVPLVACNCPVCKSDNSKNHRMRSSILITTDYQKNILVDAGPDLRNQSLKFKINQIDALLITHTHADHIGGFDDLRPFTYHNTKTIDLYISNFDFEELQKRYDYIFQPDPNYLGGPIAKINPIIFKEKEKFNTCNLEIQPIEVGHGNRIAFGFKIRNFAYIPDINKITAEEKKSIVNLDYLIVDGLWNKDPHPCHFNIKQAIEFGNEINAKKVYITHMTHNIDYKKDSENLPSNVFLCYDGLEIDA